MDPLERVLLTVAVVILAAFLAFLIWALAFDVDGCPPTVSAQTRALACS